MNLRIDPEFEKMIPPLTADEFRQLEENILEEGLVLTPIIVWNNIIIDGHNRFCIIEKHPDIKYSVHEKQFDDRYSVIAWICKNQLGRRNLTPQQKKYLIGQRYDAEKKANGASDGFRGNQYKSPVPDQFGQVPESKTTRQQIAEETHTSEGYVQRAEYFAKGVDAAEEVLPGIKEELLSGAIKPKEADVVAIMHAAPEERISRVEQLRVPKEKKRKTVSKKFQEIQKIGEDMLHARGGRLAEYMYCELENAMNDIMFRWSFCLEKNRDYYEDEVYRPQINQLAQEGIDYLQQVINGKIRENPYVGKQEGA